MVSLAGLLTACATSPRSETPAKLRIGLSPDLPPLVFLENNQLVGLEIDLARQLADALGRPVEVSTMPWKSLLKALQTDRIDVIMGAFHRERVGRIVTPAGGGREFVDRHELQGAHPQLLQIGQHRAA